MKKKLVILRFRRDSTWPLCVAVAVGVLGIFALRSIAYAQTEGRGGATAINLLDDDAKVVAVVEVSRILETPFGKQNLQSTMTSPEGEQFLSQVLFFKMRYGVNVLQDVYRVLMIAPFTDGEPFADVLFAVDAKLNRQLIEQALTNTDHFPAERHADCLIFEVTNGNGKFFCSVISDSLFIVSLEKRPIVKAIDRASANKREASRRIADAINALPGNHMAWAVADSNAFARNEEDWVLFRQNTDWLSIGVGIAGPTANFDATFQAPTEDAAMALEALLTKYLKREDAGQQIFGLLPAMIQPSANSIIVKRHGARLSVSAAGL